MALGCGACCLSYVAWLPSANLCSQNVKVLSDNVFLVSKQKPITWAKKRLTGLKSHEKPVLTAHDTMEVEVTLPQVDGVSTPIMTMTNLRRSQVTLTITVNTVTLPPHHHENTVTTAAVLEDTVHLVTPRRIQGPQEPPGPTPRTRPVALMGEALQQHKEGVLRTLDLPKIVLETQEISLVRPPLDITTALGNGARDPKEIGQLLRGMTLLQQDINHSNNNSNHNSSSSSSRALRVMLVSKGQGVRANLVDIQALNH